MPTPELTIFAVSHPGAVRPRNEDSIAIGSFVACDTLVRPTAIKIGGEARTVCAVLDGIGGQAHGEIASRLCATHLAQRLPGSIGSLEDAVAAALQEANELLYDKMASDASLLGTGAAVAGVVVEGDQLVVFNVGDSRVYRWQDGFLFQLTVDDKAAHAESRSVITQALGGMGRLSAITPHLLRENWLPGRRYLICTDGLFDALSLDAMERALALAPELALARLTADALAAHADDNFSALLLMRE